MYKRGSIYWSSVGGVRQSLRTADEAAAEALEGKLKLQNWEQRYLGAKPKKTWEEACVRWAKEKDHKVSWSDDVRHIKWWSEYLAGRDLRSITREEVDEIVQKHGITQGQSPENNTANHRIAYLAAILNSAARKWDWIDKAPLLRRYPVTDGRKRWLNPEEWKTLESSLHPYLRRAAKFALATGLRRGRLVALTWQDIKLDTASLSFQGTSNKLGNTIPLNDTAMSVLEEIQASPVRHMQLVFTKNGKPIAHYPRAWATALRKVGLQGVAGQEDFCWHGLRHTWASWLAQAGVPEWARTRLGGWSSTKMVDRYSHLDLESLRPYAAVIDTVLAQGTDRSKASA